MKLDDWIRLAVECPDGELDKEFGINDNWTFYLNTRFFRFLALMEGSEKFEFESAERSRERETRIWFNYGPGTTIVGVSNHLDGKAGFFRLLQTGKEQEYNTTLGICPYQKRKAEGDPSRIMFQTFLDIFEIIKTNRISAYFPFTKSEGGIYYPGEEK